MKILDEDFTLTWRLFPIKQNSKHIGQWSDDFIIDSKAFVELFCEMIKEPQANLGTIPWPFHFYTMSNAYASWVFVDQIFVRKCQAQPITPLRMPFSFLFHMR